MPDYRLQVMGTDPKLTKERDSTIERARKLWNNSYEKGSETGKRIEAMITQSDSLRDSDPEGAMEAARKADLLSRELPKSMTRVDVNKSMLDQQEYGGAQDATVGPLAQLAAASAPGAPWWVKLAQAADTLKGPRDEGQFGEVQEGVVPWQKKVQRKAIKTLARYPTRESYLDAGDLGQGYDNAIKRLQDDVSEVISRKPIGMDQGYAYVKDIPHRGSDAVAYYHEGVPAGGITFYTSGDVGVAGLKENFQGLGIGKDMYKLGASLGKQVFEPGMTSRSAKHARYSAIKDLAAGDVPKRPRSFGRDAQEPVSYRWWETPKMEEPVLSEEDKLQQYLNREFGWSK